MFRKLTPRSAFFVSLVIILIILVLIGIWDTSLGQDILEAGEVLSFGQLLINIILIPIIVVGFVFTMEEFRNTQELPRLYLSYIDKSDQIEQLINLELSGEHNINLALVNKGKVVSIWYVVHFDIPIELFGKVDESGNMIQFNSYGERIPFGLAHERYGRTVGDKDNFQSITTQKAVHIAFMSNGKVASFPESPLPFITINLPHFGHRDISKDYLIPFKIFTDRGQPSQGSIVIRFQGNNINVN